MRKELCDLGSDNRIKLTNHWFAAPLNADGVRQFQPRATPWVRNEQTEMNSERVRES